MFHVIATRNASTNWRGVYRPAISKSVAEFDSYKDAADTASQLRTKSVSVIAYTLDIEPHKAESLLSFDFYVEERSYIDYKSIT